MKKLSRREFLRLSTVAAAGALVAACAKGQAPAETPQAEGPTATPKQAAEQATNTPVPAGATWPRGEVPRTRTVIEMYGDAEFTNVGICNPYATGFNHQQGMAAELEAMFYYAALADKTYPHLAESYKYNDDATELTVNLRKGAEWSDGTPFTASDIAFTYNSLIAMAPDLRDSARIKVLTKEVQAADDYTVKFTLASPNYRYHDTECTFRFDRGVYIVPEHVFKDVQGDWREFRFNSEGNADWPVVVGAYKRSADTPTHKHFDLRDDWWAIKTGFMPKPQVERLIQIGFTDDTKAAQLIINNEIDHCLDLRPRTIASILEQAPHCITFTGREKPYGYVDWWPISMYFNTLEEPYTDKRVRWAIALSVDQQQLVDVGWDGAGKVTYHPFPEYPGLMKYIDAAKDLFDQYNVLDVNLDKSADLMKEAGFEKDSEGFWAKNGQRPDTDIWAAVPLFGDIAPVTAEQLRKGGFDSQHVTPPDVWAGKDDGRAMLHFFGHGGSVQEPFTTLDMYHIRNQKPTGESCGDNRPRWGNQAYSDIVDELSQTSPQANEAKCIDLFHQAMAIWLDELPEVPLVQWFHRIPLNTTYWDNWPTQNTPYNTALWHITMPITLWNLKATQ
jgi:peptide/nickel transport system substrate-binding protein